MKTNVCKLDSPHFFGGLTRTLTWRAKYHVEKRINNSRSLWGKYGFSVWEFYTNSLFQSISEG